MFPLFLGAKGTLERGYGREIENRSRNNVLGAWAFVRWWRNIVFWRYEDLSAEGEMTRPDPREEIEMTFSLRSLRLFS